MNDLLALSILGHRPQTSKQCFTAVANLSYMKVARVKGPFYLIYFIQRGRLKCMRWSYSVVMETEARPREVLKVRVELGYTIRKLNEKSPKVELHKMEAGSIHLPTNFTVSFFSNSTV